MKKGEGFQEILLIMEDKRKRINESSTDTIQEDMNL